MWTFPVIFALKGKIEIECGRGEESGYSKWQPTDGVNSGQVELRQLLLQNVS